MKSEHRRMLAWIPVILWMIVIFMFSAQNANDSTNTSSASAELLADFFRLFSGIISENTINTLVESCQFIVRKIAHFSEYAILGVLSYNALRKYRFPHKKTAPIISSVLCVVYAVSDELHQYFVPERSCRITDVLIDFSGAVFGITMFIAIKTIIRRVKNNE